MKHGLTGWIAGVREYRMALIVAIAGSLALILLLIAPPSFFPEQSTSGSKAGQSKATAYNLPQRPASATSTDMETDQTPLRKTGKHPAPQTKKTVSPQNIPDHKPVVAVTRPLKSKNRLAYGYYVQVGAFKDAARARKLGNSLQHAGWHVQTVIKNHGLHAVLAGPLQTRKKAESAKLKLAKRSGIKGFIIFNTPGN